MRNSLFAWGPRFKRDFRSPTAWGIVDVAPTIRYLLGLPAVPADGRVLHEALAGGPSAADVPVAHETHQRRPPPGRAADTGRGSSYRA